MLIILKQTDLDHLLHIEYVYQHQSNIKIVNVYLKKILLPLYYQMTNELIECNLSRNNFALKMFISLLCHRFRIF